MKKLLLLFMGAMLLLQFSSFGQTKLTKKQPVSDKTSICERLQPKVTKRQNHYVVSLKSNLVDDWALFLDTDKAEPIYSKRNRVQVTQDGKYKLAAKIGDKICLTDVNLTNSASRGVLSSQAGWEFLSALRTYGSLEGVEHIFKKN